MPIARSLKWENDMEFQDVFPLFSQKAAQVCSIKWLTRMMNEPFWYDLDVVVADGTGVINLSLSDGVSTRLIGEYSRCHRLPGLRVKTLPTFIEDEILGKCALFEVIFRSKSTAVRRFNVSRLSEDEEVFEQYELKYLPKEKEEVEAGGRCKALQPLKRRRIV
ncbi:hypothetical protein CASFOL_032032 [Castilleja foliolosa]|uniref:Uncharacterized protein n=1 Tax=Castilleja foliolosa TaxID=1961234 RepID=A0ABD3C213_9LAMI